MTKMKNPTKRALMLSVMALVLCFTMLVGTTYAWFTDSVTSGKNKIVAGNLDVEVFHTNDKVKDEDLTGAENLFPVDKWEPGVVSYETFTITNKGTLALDYEFNFRAVDFNNVVLADGTATDLNLKDVIKIGIIEGAVDKDTTREELIAKVNVVEEKEGSAAKKLASFNDVKFGSYMEGETNEKTFTVVAYWEPNVKNDDDYNVNNGKSVDKPNGDANELYIDIAVNVYAKQRTYENDSFEKDYDEKALYQWDDDSTARVGNTFYKTLKEAVDAAQDNDTITLYNGTLSDKDGISINKNLTISGTGNKESELNGVQFYVGNNVKLTLENIHFTGKSAVLTEQTGNNEISINDCLIEAAFKHSAYGRAAFILGRHQAQATKLTITNNTFLRHAADDQFAMAIFTWNAIQSGSVIKGNTFGSEDNRFTFAAIKIMNSADDGGLISLCDNTFYGTDNCWVVQLALQHDYNIKFLFKDNAFNGGGMAIDLDPDNGAAKYTKTEVYISDGNTYNDSALTSDKVEDYGNKYSDNSINWGDPT